MRASHKLWQTIRSWQSGNLEKVPSYWAAYVRAQDQSPAGTTPVDELSFVVLDTETTGLDHKTDRVVSFGAVRICNREIHVAEAFDCRVRGELPSGADSIEVHGVLNRELESGVSEDRFTELLVRYVGQSVIVGYRPGFDMAMLNRLVSERTGGRLVNPILDVFELGMRVDYPLKPPFVNPEHYRLDVLCERYGIAQPQRHTAMGDAYATALLFLMLLERLKEGGVTNLRELKRRYI